MKRVIQKVFICKRVCEEEDLDPGDRQAMRWQAEQIDLPDT